MAVFRIKKTNDYTVMSNNHFKNRNLSLKAKGLLSLMLSLPDDWDYTLEGLTTLNADGRDSIRTAMQELEHEGYLILGRVRDKTGRLGDAIYDVYESPQTEKPITENPTLVNPTLEKPMLEKPISENPTQLNTNISNTKESNTKGLNTNISNTNVIRHKPTLEEIQQYCYERDNSIDAERFYDYYESNGWKVGKNPMKDWKACVRTWERNYENSNNNREAQGGTTRTPEQQAEIDRLKRQKGLL